MQSPELRSLALTGRWRALLLRAGYTTAAEVLLVPPATLVRKTHLAPAEVTALVFELAAAVEYPAGSTSRTVADLLSLTPADDDIDVPPAQIGALTTGDAGMDELLGGGVHVGHITEFVGEAASGKSHICLQLALTVQLPLEYGGLAGGAVLISSEGTLPSQRLLALAKSLAGRLPPPAVSEWDMMDNIHTAKATDMDALASLLSYFVPALIESTAAYATAGTVSPSHSYSPSSTPPPEPLPPRPPQKPPLPIRLIIVDSIAAPVRVAHETDSRGFIQRSKDLNGASDALKRLAHLHACAVVVVNQVSAVFSRPHAPTPPPDGAHASYNLPRTLFNRFQGPHFSGEQGSPGGENAAALGHSWTNAISARVMLARTARATTGEPGVKDGTPVRSATLIFSPCAPTAQVDFVVDQDGIRTVNGYVGEGSLDGQI